MECTEKIYEREYERQKENPTGKDDVAMKIILEGILTTYNKFIKRENPKPAYYMSDAEVKERIEIIKTDLREHLYTDIFDLLKKADEVYIWCNVMALSTSDVEGVISEEVPKEYEKLLAKKGKLDFALSSRTDTVESPQMKAFLADFKEKETEIYVEWIIEQFQNSLEEADYRKIYQQLDDLVMLFEKLQRSGKTNIIAQFSQVFCNEYLLPINSISEIQYYCCQRAYALAMTYFSESYYSCEKR